MNWSQPVDLYCERVGASFWAEPVNALTNAAFLLAAAIACVRWWRAGARDWPTLALIVVLVAIGFGSFAFHTLATRGAVYLDVIPIAVFIYGGQPSSFWSSSLRSRVCCRSLLTRARSTDRSTICRPLPPC
jgi:hypothetical protein